MDEPMSVFNPPNPYPSTALHEKSFRKDIAGWVDREIELGQDASIQDALHRIMRLTKGKCSPQTIIDKAKARGLE